MFTDLCFGFERFFCKNLRDLLETALIFSIFELEFCQKLIGAIIRVLMWYAAPTSIVWHRIKTHTLSKSVTRLTFRCQVSNEKDPNHGGF